MLRKITKTSIESAAAAHRQEWGDTNEKIAEMFSLWEDNTAYGSVRIKAAVINSIYSTRIGNLDPVVRRIMQVFGDVEAAVIPNDQVALVDLIADVKWTDKKGVQQQRNYLSFASKFMHFQSGYRLPIFDEYMWQVMRAYLRCLPEPVIIADRPGTYAKAYAAFGEFTKLYDLGEHSTYDIEKYLWRTFRELMRKLEKEASKQSSPAVDFRKLAGKELKKLTRLG
jgi:hypothetical protein